MLCVVCVFAVHFFKLCVFLVNVFLDLLVCLDVVKDVKIFSSFARCSVLNLTSVQESLSTHSESKTCKTPQQVTDSLSIKILNESKVFSLIPVQRLKHRAAEPVKRSSESLLLT